jgi:GTP 3',8-cyclase
MNSGALPDLFEVVEIEVNSRCNRSCVYCPVSFLRPNSQRTMAAEVFATLLDNLARLEFAGRISYHRYSEPLLRLDLEDLVALVSHRLPFAKQVLYTNGDLLSRTRYETLCRAGVNQFIVTRHDGTPIQQRPRQIVLYPTDLLLTNRGGSLGHLARALTEPCMAPTEMLIVALNGDVLLCYEDSRAENVMGNILTADLRAIWQSERFAKARYLLAAGRRAQAGSLCAHCDNRAHVVEGQSRFMETRRGTF